MRIIVQHVSSGQTPPPGYSLPHRSGPRTSQGHIEGSRSVIHAHRLFNPVRAALNNNSRGSIQDLAPAIAENNRLHGCPRAVGFSQVPIQLPFRHTLTVDDTVSELSVRCPNTPGYFFGTGCRVPFTSYSTRRNSTRSRDG